MSMIVVTPPAAAARGRSGEALPLGAAGLVDVHVGVDQAGQEHLVVLEVHRAGGRGRVVVRRDRGDPLAAHPHARGDLGAADDGTPSPEDQVEAVRHQQKPGTCSHASPAGGASSRVTCASIRP